MSFGSWLRRALGLKPPAPPLPLDEQPGIIGSILRLGEAAGGNAQAAEHEQSVADGDNK